MLDSLHLSEISVGNSPISSKFVHQSCSNTKWPNLNRPKSFGITVCLSLENRYDMCVLKFCDASQNTQIECNRSVRNQILNIDLILEPQNNNCIGTANKTSAEYFLNPIFVLLYKYL